MSKLTESKLTGFLSGVLLMLFVVVVSFAAFPEDFASLCVKATVEAGDE